MRRRAVDRPHATGPAGRRALRAARPDAPERAREDGGGPDPAASNPPLHYLSEAPAYLTASSGGFFGRVLAMRLALLLWARRNRDGDLAARGRGAGAELL